MKLVLIACAGLTLAACGADGEPVYPTANHAVSISNTGISASTNVAVTQGPFTVSMGVGL